VSPTIAARAALPLLLLGPLALAPAAAPPPRETADAEAVAGGPRLVVLDKSDATLSVHAVDDGRLLARLPTGAGPHEVAVSADGRLAVVANYGDRSGAGRSLGVYDLVEPRLLREVDLGAYRRPHGIAFEDGSRRVLVTCEENRAVLRVDVVEGRVVDALSTDQGGSHMLALAPGGGRVFTANMQSGSVTAIDLESGEVAGIVAAGAQAEGIDVTPDGREVWVSNRADDTLTIIDAHTLAVLDELPCRGFPIRVRFTPDGAHALVSNARSGDVAVFEVLSRREVRRIPMAPASVEDADERLFGAEFAQSPTPVGILVQPDGARAYVANTNADQVTVLDLDRWTAVARYATGREPDGMAWAPAPAAADAPEPLHVGLVVVDGVYNTELTAPMDIFQHTIFHTRPGMRVFTVGPSREAVTSFEGLRILPDHGYAEAPRIDVLVVPSAEHSMDTDLEDEELLAFVRERGTRADWVVSLCDGAFVLAAAGLLDGRRATTFPADVAAFRERFPAVDVHADVSFVRDGNAITSVGGAPSFEAALYLCELLYGAEVARGIAGGLVIDWSLDDVRHLAE